MVYRKQIVLYKARHLDRKTKESGADVYRYTLHARMSYRPWKSEDVIAREGQPLNLLALFFSDFTLNGILLSRKTICIRYRSRLCVIDTYVLKFLSLANAQLKKAYAQELKN